MVRSGDPEGPSQRPPPNLLLATVGVLLLIAAVGGLAIGRNAALTGAFLGFGAALLVVAALEPRMEGKQEFHLNGFKINISRAKKATNKAEAELKSGKPLASPKDLTP